MTAAQRETLLALDRSEAGAVGRRVIAPVDGVGQIAVDVQGLVWMLRPDVAFRGWGVFEVQSDRTAQWLRTAEPWEIDQYAHTCRRYRAVVVHPPIRTEEGRAVVALPGEGRVLLVHLTPAVNVFDSIDLCFDGRRYWCLEVRSHDPRIEPWQAALYRGKADMPGRLSRVYELARRLMQDRRTSTLDERIKAALEVAGARLVEVQGCDGTVGVRWHYQGQAYQSRVDANSLGVVSSGVCLSGRDADYDLTSLVSVMGERSRTRGDHEGW